MSASEIYDAATDFLLREIREDRRLERKPAGVHAEVLGEYFAMWANTPPEGGLIAIGIENNGVCDIRWHRAKTVLEQLKAKGIFGEKRRKDIARDPQSYYFLKHPNGKTKKA